MIRDRLIAEKQQQQLGSTKTSATSVEAQQWHADLHKITQVIRSPYFDEDAILHRMRLIRTVKTTPHDVSAWRQLLSQLKGDRQEAQAQKDGSDNNDTATNWEMHTAMVRLFETATSVIPRTSANRYSPVYLSIWLDLASIHEEMAEDSYLAREVYKQLKNNRIGTTFPALWDSYADFEERQGDPEKAKKLRKEIARRCPSSDIKSTVCNSKSNAAVLSTPGTSNPPASVTRLKVRASPTQTDTHTPVQGPPSSTLRENKENRYATAGRVRPSPTPSTCRREIKCTPPPTALPQPKRMHVESPEMMREVHATPFEEPDLVSGGGGVEQPNHRLNHAHASHHIQQPLHRQGSHPSSWKLRAQQPLRTPSNSAPPPPNSLSDQRDIMSPSDIGPPSSRKSSDQGGDSSSSTSKESRRRVRNQYGTRKNEGFFSRLKEIWSDEVTTVNGKEYLILSNVGKGGSSKVYKVLDERRTVLALKRVTVRKSASFKLTFDSYANEIDLLQRLRGKPSIVHCYEAEVREDLGIIQLVMEYGDIDLAKLLTETNSKKRSLLDENFRRVYWTQMLEAVRTIHEAKIVHGDLKPANFLVVAGTLKLIDFGIAKAIPTEDTTKIFRDVQIGTPNYMAPEALTVWDDDDDDPNYMRGQYDDGADCRPKYRVGRASDIWSLGCILYQMVYGKTPFAHLMNIAKKMRCIQDETYRIQYPPVNDPDVLSVLHGCLQRDPTKRLLIPALLSHPYLRRGTSYIEDARGVNDDTDDSDMGSVVKSQTDLEEAIRLAIERYREYESSTNEMMNEDDLTSLVRKLGRVVPQEIAARRGINSLSAPATRSGRRGMTPTTSAITNQGTRTGYSTNHSYNSRFGL